MAEWYTYKTKAGVIVAVGLGTDGEGTAKITVLDHNIPPSQAKFIDSFKADNLCDYINKMIPVLLENLNDDPEVQAIYDAIAEGGHMNM